MKLLIVSLGIVITASASFAQPVCGNGGNRSGTYVVRGAAVGAVTGAIVANNSRNHNVASGAAYGAAAGAIVGALIAPSRDYAPCRPAQQVIVVQPSYGPGYAQSSATFGRATPEAFRMAQQDAAAAQSDLEYAQQQLVAAQSRVEYAAAKARAAQRTLQELQN